MSSESSNPSVVVGISTLNRAEVVRKAMSSALNQSYKPLRVALIDDASSDHTPRLRDQFPTVTWERADPPIGYVEARNRMMLTAPEDYYVSLDDDAWFMQDDEIALAVEYLERNQNIAAVAFDILSPDAPKAANRGRILPAAIYIGCGHVLRLSAVKELGGYVRFPGPYGGEEKDFCLRLIDAGYGLVKLEGVHVWHDKSEAGRDWPRWHRSGVFHDLITGLRRFPLSVVIPAVMWRMASHLIFGFRTGQFGPTLLGIGDFLRVSPEVWRRRSPVRLSSLLKFRSLSKASV